MDRILVNTKGDIRITFYDAAGAAVDATGTPTIQVLRADGTELVIAGTATSKVTPGTGIYKYTLTSTHTALLDALTARWTAVIDGASQTFSTHVEVVGGFLFSIADARAVAPLTSTTAYPTATIVQYRTLAEHAFEHAAGRAFVPRFTYEPFDGNGRRLLNLNWPDVRSIRSVTIDGIALTTTELADITWLASRGMYRAGGWDAGYRNVIVGYEHGMSYPPPRVADAVLTLAKTRLVRGPIDERDLQRFIGDETTGRLITLATPGLRGATFGIPEVDGTLQDYALTSVVG